MDDLNDVRKEVEERSRESVVEQLQSDLEPFAAGDVNVNRIGESEWALDWKLGVAEDAPFSSSATYDEEDDVFTGIALRFSPRLFDQLPDKRIRDRFEAIIERTDPPAGTLWHSYIRGDAEETGPHILAPGGFSQVDRDEFLDWLPRLLDEYERVFE